ncbi:MAG: hypothetical protein WC508_03010 [Patescibacteria group bacterium]
MPYLHLDEHDIEEKFSKKNRKNKPKMKISGKSVFDLKKIISQKAKLK